jgi:glutamate/tyrosine decarboxylase-like PLP-dependent enzyme
MREDIKHLELLARVLEPNAAARGILDTSVHRHAEAFLMHIDSGKGYEIKDTSAPLQDFLIREEGSDVQTLLDLVSSTVDHPGINPASGGHLGYIPGGGLYPAALADFLADVTNRYSGVYFANPGAARMENFLVRWMADLIGYPEEAHGTLTSGGSIANLVAMTTARDALQIKSADIPTAVIYLTEQTHHCVDKAIRIAGMGECIVRKIPLDGKFRMQSQTLLEQIRIDKKNGLRPAIVIASLGSTDTGAVDPVDEIGMIARTEGLWFQIDAAYGGFFQLVPELGHHFKGIEKSDSYILDPHKGLFLPYGTGTVLVRNGSQLHASYWYRANYLQDAESPDQLSPAELSPELTRPFRGLRMWLPMQLYGLAPFRAALKEKWLLAQYFHGEIQKLGFEVGPEPALSVAIYRYTEGVQDTNAFNRRLVRLLHEDGRIFISSTMIDGSVWLRLAVLCFRTHLSHIDLLLEMLQQARDTAIREQ